MFLLELTLTPALIGGASLVQRRFGSTAGGWLVGLPLTAAPVSLFLALEQGPRFAADAASATLLGLASLCAFCLAYARTAARARPAVASATALAAYLAAAGLASLAPLPLVVAFAACAALLRAVLAVMPSSAAPHSASRLTRAEIGLRMAAATTVVLVLTGTATTLGPRWSGLLTPFPVFAGTLAAFTHRSQGPDAAADFLRGVVSGSFGYAVFFLVVGAAVEDLGIGPSFAAALVAAVACQAPFGRAPRRPAGAESGAPFSQ